MPPPRRHLGPGVGPQPGHPTISRSSSSLSDRSAVADGRREPLPSPAAMPAPAVQLQQQATPPAQQQQQPGPATQPQPPAPPAVAAALQPAPMPPVKVESAPKAAGIANQQPLPSPAALGSQPGAPIMLPALPPAAEAPPAPATPAVRREPEHSSSTAKPLVEPPRLGSSGPLLQFGDVPIVMSEVQAPMREGPHIAAVPHQQQHQQPILPLEAQLASAGPTLPARLPAAQPDIRSVPFQQPQQPRMHPDLHRSLQDGVPGLPQHLRPQPPPQSLAQGPRTVRPQAGRNMVMTPQGMLPRLQGAPPHEALHPGLAMPDYHSPMQSRPSSAHSPHGLPELPHPHGAGMASAGFPGAAGFPPTPPHMHHLPPHQLPMQMSFPAGPPSRSPLPGQRGHFMPPGSPTGVGRQNMLLQHPFINMPGPHQALPQPAPPPNLGFAPQGRQLPPGVGPQAAHHGHYPAQLPYGLPNGHPLPGMLPVEARHGPSAARQVLHPCCWPRQLCSGAVWAEGCSRVFSCSPCLSHCRPLQAGCKVVEWPLGVTSMHWLAGLMQHGWK